MMLSTEKNRKRVVKWLMVTFVVYAIVNSWVGYVDSKNTKKFVNELSYEYIQQQNKFKRLYDSATVERLKLTFQVVELKGELDGLKNRDEIFDREHWDEFKRLEKKYRNEKDYIPNINTDKQLDVITNYEYKELP